MCRGAGDAQCVAAAGVGGGPDALCQLFLYRASKISQAELVRIRLDRPVCGCVVVLVMPIVQQWRWLVEKQMLCVNCFL